ncbi:MAG: hypothetical protein GY712_10625, partial [Oceanicoccus sp.]|uniref:hypothetical protein n=1 Tax=Oceanicoccus sp. TaxID=2691044 RepID=UPI0026352C84
MALEPNESIGVGTALAAVESFANSTTSSLYDAATSATHNLNDALIRMGISNDIVNGINMSELQADISSSISNLQSQIQDSIDFHSGELNAEIRAANIASDISKLPGPVGNLFDVAELVSASIGGDSAAIGNVLSGALLGAIAGKIASAIVGMLGLTGAAAFGAIVLGIAAGVALNELLPVSLKESIGDVFQNLSDKFGELLDWMDPIGILDDVSDFFGDALGWTYPRDPITLDLDGDGLETVGTEAGVLFDHNADGIQTGTGWIGADD